MEMKQRELFCLNNTYTAICDIMIYGKFMKYRCMVICDNVAEQYIGNKIAIKHGTMLS